MTSSKSFLTRGVVWKLWHFFCSIKLAVILIIAVTLLAVVGSLLPQMPREVAANPQDRAQWLATAKDKYGSLAGFYQAIALFQVFDSPWFTLLLIALLLNTLVCTLNRFNTIWKSITKPRVRMPDLFYERASQRASWVSPLRKDTIGVVVDILSGRRYRVRVEKDGDTSYLYADLNRFAPFGTLVTHISLVILVVGAVWGWRAGWRENQVTLGPGQVYEVGHGKGFQVRNDGFEIKRYLDGSPQDYIGHLTVLEQGKEVVRQTVRVNHPLTYRGVTFYLASYGPALRISASDSAGQPVPLQVNPEGSPAGEVVLNLMGRGGEEEISVPSQNLTLGMVYQAQPFSLFVRAFHRGEAHSFFADTVEPGHPLELPGARFDFVLDRYTVLMAVNDPSFSPVILASFLLLGGLVLSFYFPHHRLWARMTAAGEIRLVGLAERERREDLARRFAALSKEIGKGIEREG
ncbi:MAG: cytochrome c biogenesis protein ResB [Anaerolineae bacterium]